MHENHYPMDAAVPEGICSSGVAVNKINCDRHFETAMDTRNDTHDPIHSFHAQNVLLEMNRNEHELTNDSDKNETDDEQQMVPCSLSPNSTGSVSPSKADSVSSAMSTSSEIIPTYGVDASSCADNCRGNDIAFRTDHFPDHDDCEGGKTVSSDELNNEPIDRHKGNKALRRGKWTQEEEAFVARAIHDFNCGFLNVPAGTTLRTYLSDKLQCNPMRVTKKFTGDSCIGKRVFHPAMRSESNAAAIDKAQMELEALESRWRRRLEAQHRESQKKVTSSLLSSAQSNILCLSSSLMESAPSQLRDSTELTQAVNWLEQANAVLSNDSSARQDFETEMQQVQRLIFEAPIIHNISVAIPRPRERSSSINPIPLPLDPLVHPNVNDEYTDPDVKRKVTYKTAQKISSPMLRPTLPENQSFSSPGSRNNQSTESGHIQIIPMSLSQDEKRARTANNIANKETTPPCVEEAVAEDAATLMDFLFSVRNEAAAASKI